MKKIHAPIQLYNLVVKYIIQSLLIKKMGQEQSDNAQSQKSGCLNLCLSRRYYMKKQIQRTIKEYNNQPIQDNIYEKQLQRVKSFPKNCVTNQNDYQNYHSHRFNRQKQKQITLHRENNNNKNNQNNQLNVNQLYAQVILLGLQSNVVQNEIGQQKQNENCKIQNDQDNIIKLNANYNVTHITGQGLGITANQYQQGDSQQNQQYVCQNSSSSNKFSISFNSNKQLLVNKIESLKKKYVKNQIKNEYQKTQQNKQLHNTPKKEAKYQQIEIVQFKKKAIQQRIKKSKIMNQQIQTDKKIQKKQESDQKIRKQRYQIQNQEKKQNLSLSHKQNNVEKSKQSNLSKQNVKQYMKEQEKQKATLNQFQKQDFHLKQINNKKNDVTQIVQFFSQSSSSSSSKISTVQNDHFFFTSQHVFENKINMIKKPLDIAKQNQISLNTSEQIVNKNQVKISQSIKTENKNSCQSQNISRTSRKITSLNCTKLINF